MSADDRRHNNASPTRTPADALHELEHRVEDAVEEVIHVAERSLARRFGDGCVRAVRLALRTAWMAFVIAYFAFGALWLTTRYYLMPHIDEYRPLLEREVSRMLATRVQIGQIESVWHGFDPTLRLINVQIFDRSGRAALTLPRLEATLSWTSVPALQVRFRELSIMAPQLDVQRQDDGRFLVAGFLLDPKATGGDDRLAAWVLAQPHIAIRDARVNYLDASVEAEPIQFDDVDVEFRRGLVNDRFALRARPPAALGDLIDLRIEFRRPWFARATDLSQWTGRIFAQTDYADVARVAALAHMLPADVAVERAHGALRSWLEFDRGHLGRAIADLALVDASVRLGARLAPLQIERLQGRIEQRAWGTPQDGGQEFAVKQLAFAGAGLVLPPTDASVRLTRAAAGQAQQGLAEVSGLSLTTISALSTYLPLPASWHETADRLGLRGTLTNARYAWSGAADAPARYQLRTQFEGLTLSSAPADPPLTPAGHPRPGRPGFSNLSGSVDLDQDGGTVNVRAHEAVLTFPGVFGEPLPFSALNADASWSLRNGFELRIGSLAATSPAIELSGRGTYRSGGKGIGTIDASGQVRRAQAAEIHRFIPLVVSSATREWLRTALVAGTAHDGSFKLKGDLVDFPFARPASGEFLVKVGIVDGTLDYLPAHASESADAHAWPRLANIDGDFLFERNRIEITARRAQVYGVQVGPVRATIPDVTAADARLQVDGKGSGPLADLVRFVNESPVGGWLHGLLAQTKASGRANFDLKLDIPLAQAADTKLRGSVALAQNDVQWRDGVPPFARATGKVDFSEKSVTISGLTGQFAGGPFRADVATRSDGTIEIVGSGTVMPEAAGQAIGPGMAQRLLGRAHGAARYSARISVKGGQTTARITSDLSGLSLDLPEPLNKNAADVLPLRVEIVPRSTERNAEGDTLRVSADARFALALDRSYDANGAMTIERGAFAVGSGDVAALALPDRGIRGTVVAARLNADRWMRLSDELGAAGAGSTVDAVSARIGELVIGGKSIANLVLGATRQPTGTWIANVTSDHVNGAIDWHPSEAGKPGRVSARFTQLTIPAQDRTQLSDLLDAPPTELPAFDLIADEFELAGHALGRLELQARNIGSGASAAWQLQKLDLSNPAGHMTATGQWQRDGNLKQRRMAISFALDFSDAGNLLARFGMPGTLRGGEGKLEGDLAWRGSPFAIDYPSLAGKLKLSTSKGQFLKADPGVARLLGVLSLQALPRRITLDFRDVFSEGFAFDSVTGTADVEAGVLTTRDFKMRGVNANVLIEGTADLRQETQNLHVLVVPDVNAGSASLMYALLANPAVGLGAFIAQWVLRDPLSKAFSHEFDVTGKWSDPQVKRREIGTESAPSTSK